MTKDNNTIAAEELVAQLVNVVGERFVVIPLDGWTKIVTVLHDASNEEDEESLLKKLEDLNVPVVPVELTKKEESSIITPENHNKIIVQ